MEIININNKNYREAVKKAADFIKRGKVVVFPTDTVYGLIGNAIDKKVVDKIFKIKKRDKKKYLSIFIKDMSVANKMVFIDSNQKKIIKRYWPGKFTFILKRKAGGKLYGIDKDTVALRIPKHKPLNNLLKKLDFPLVQTSANISGVNPITTAREAIAEFGNNQAQPDLIIDGGKLSGKASKITDLTGNTPKILRK